jgi:rare lipoprotein A (peptidoglycan hydrolase)
MPAHAAMTGGYKQFFLDQGFMGHDFSLDVDDWGMAIAFSSSSIPWPGVLHVMTQPVDAIRSESDNTRFGSEVSLQWTTNAPDSPSEVIVRLSDKACGKTAWHICSLEQTYQGQTQLLKPEHPVAGRAEAKVKMGATIRLVEVENYMSEGYASWYAYKRCPCAASPDFPKGSLVRVTNLDVPDRQIVVKINDFGPERDIFPDRAIDLDKVAFAQIASLGAGVIKVKVEPLAADDPEALAYAQSTTAILPKQQAADTHNEWQL